jgi:hypothetical protein
MFGQFLSSWKCFLLIRTSFCMDREGRLVEQVQDPGPQLTKFVVYLYIVDASFCAPWYKLISFFIFSFSFS